MSIERIKPQIITLGGFPGTGKSTIVRCLRDEFGFPANQIVSYDRIAKQQYKEVDPAFDMANDVPSAYYYSKAVKLDRLRRVYTQARGIVNAGKPALLHMVCSGTVSRLAFNIGTIGKPVSGFWLNADYEALQERLKARAFDNTSNGSADMERLTPIFEAHATTTAPKGWTEISTQDTTPSAVALQILNHLNAAPAVAYDLVAE